MEKNTISKEIFNILRRENLDSYTDQFVKEAITPQILFELNDKEIDELALLLKMPFGHKHSLKKLIQNSEHSIQEVKSSLSSKVNSAHNSQIVVNPNIENLSSLQNQSHNGQIDEVILPFDDNMIQKVFIGIDCFLLSANF